jgi:trehalose/maltose transport system substrate-binding protein
MNSYKNFFCVAIGAVAMAIGTMMAHAVNLRIACGAGPALAQCQKAAEAWAKENGHTAEMISTPNSATEQLALFQQILAAGSDEIDIFQIDVVWPGTLAAHMVDLKPAAKGAESEYFPAIVQNNTVGDKLVGMPWFTDAPVLYYRKDLLEKYGEPVPETWEQLTVTSETIQKAEREAGNDKFWGYVWQGRSYEGLTCDALEWVASHNGGTIIEPDGKISINNPNAIAAINQAKPWVNTISPGGVLNYTEEESRGVFQSGNALFMRNWPYAWALSQGEDSTVKGKVGIAPLPKGGEDGRHAATLGGWQLAVSKYSANPEVAAELVMYLAGPEVQKQRAIELSLLPTLPSLYEDADILKANPFFADMKEILADAVARPSTVTGSKYNQVSSEFFNAVHAVLSGSSSAEQSLSSLESSLKRLSRGGKW